MIATEFVATATVLLEVFTPLLPIAVGFNPFLGAIRFRVQAAGKVQEGRRDINVADHGIGRNAAFLLIGIAYHKGDLQTAFVYRGFPSGKGHAMVGCEDDHGFVVEVGFLEYLDQPSQTLVDASAGLVVLCQLFPRLWRVGKKGGNVHLGRIEKDFLNPRIGAPVGLVAKQVGFQDKFRGLVGAPTTVWVVGGKIEEEGSRIRPVRQERPAGIGHLDRTASVALEVGFKAIHLFGRDVILANLCRSVTGILQDTRQRQTHDVIERSEFMEVMLMPVLPILVVVQPGHHDRTTRAATGGGGKCIAKERAISRQGVDLWRHGHLIPITAQGRALVIGDKENDVTFSRSETGPRNHQAKRDQRHLNSNHIVLQSVE